MRGFIGVSLVALAVTEIVAFLMWFMIAGSVQDALPGLLVTQGMIVFILVILFARERSEERETYGKVVLKYNTEWKALEGALLEFLEEASVPTEDVLIESRPHDLYPIEVAYQTCVGGRDVRLEVMDRRDTWSAVLVGPIPPRGEDRAIGKFVEDLDEALKDRWNST
jgi:hypothetical protein